jgi:hypothetical protein
MKRCDRDQILSSLDEILDIFSDCPKELLSAGEKQFVARLLEIRKDLLRNDSRNPFYRPGNPAEKLQSSPPEPRGS